MQQDDYLIPRRLDDPPTFFFWDADIAVVMIIFLLLGALLGWALVGGVLGFLLARGLDRIKADGGQGVIPRFLYWYTPSEWWLKARAPSHVREYIG